MSHRGKPSTLRLGTAVPAARREDPSRGVSHGGLTQCRGRRRWPDGRDSTTVPPQCVVSRHGEESDAEAVMAVVGFRPSLRIRRQSPVVPRLQRQSAKEEHAYPSEKVAQPIQVIDVGSIDDIAPASRGGHDERIHRARAGNCC
jgi:hypothetical protein